VPCNATWLRVVNLESGLLADLSALDIDEVDVVSSGMDHTEMVNSLVDVP